MRKAFIHRQIARGATTRMAHEQKTEQMLIDLPVVQESNGQSPSTVDHHGLKAWRSIDDLNSTTEFEALNAGEFAPRATEDPTAGSRRDFMKIMGASMAMAGLTACRRPAEKILPHTRKPEEIIPGKPLYYATAMPFEGAVRALLVETHDGRPTKVEGNPDHPVSMGSTGVYEQASLLNLYDPDRSKTVRMDGADSNWNSFASFASGLPNSSRVLVIASTTSSMTERRLRADLERKFASVDWVQYSPAGDHASLEGSQLAFGKALQPSYDFSEAAIIVSLDADFLGAGASNEVSNMRGYSDSRRVMTTDDSMSRLYVAESTFSTTGGMADHRLVAKSSRIAALASALAAKLGTASSGATLEAKEQAWVDAIASDLTENQGQSVVLAGRDQPAAVHAACALINSGLGNVGNTVSYMDNGNARPPTSDLTDAAEAIRSGSYDVLLILESNPVYSAPDALEFGSAVSSIPTSIHLGSHVDETAILCNWHIPAAHYMEAWGDGRADDGTVSVIQPLIAPLYDDAKSRIEVLNLLSGSGSLLSGFELVQGTMTGVLTGDFDKAWRKGRSRRFCHGNGVFGRCSHAYDAGGRVVGIFVHGQWRR